MCVSSSTTMEESKLFLQFVILLFLLPDVTCDYFWMDFHGDIPKEAFEGGQNEFGQPIYVGQTYFPDHAAVMPSTIKKNNSMATAILENNILQSDKFTKILCSHNKTSLFWKPTNTTVTHLMTNCQQVIGGVFKDNLLTIGRARYQRKLVIGKIIESQALDLKGLYVFDYGDKEKQLTSYEILTARTEEKHDVQILEKHTTNNTFTFFKKNNEKPRNKIDDEDKGGCTL